MHQDDSRDTGYYVFPANTYVYRKTTHHYQEEEKMVGQTECYFASTKHTDSVNYLLVIFPGDL